MHVLEHAEPSPVKTAHSVFDMYRKEILGAVDEAWLKKSSPVVGDPGAYVVPMGRAIGTSEETNIKILFGLGPIRSLPPILLNREILYVVSKV